METEMLLLADRVAPFYLITVAYFYLTKHIQNPFEDVVHRFPIDSRTLHGHDRTP